MRVLIVFSRAPLTVGARSAGPDDACTIALAVAIATSRVKPLVGVITSRLQAIAAI